LLVDTGVAETGLVIAIELEGITKDGVSEMVAFPELGGAIVALLGATGDAVEAGDSEAGMLLDGIGDGVTVGPDETPEPEIPEGVMPDGVGSMAEGVGTTEDPALGVIVGVSLGIGGVRLADSDGVGTAPDGVGMMPEGVGTTPEGVIPEGRSTDEMSEAMLDAMLLAGGRGTGAVAVGNSEAKLDTMLGITEIGRSGIAEDRRLETSETNEETNGGRMPDGVGTGDGVTGAVGPADPEGRTPLTSETREDRIDGRFKGPVERTASDVGIATEPDGVIMTGVGDDAPVPNAVVIPTTMPPEESCTSGDCPLDGDARIGVGWTTLPGTGPVEPTCGLGVASGGVIRVESRPPTRP
jgi:hypothetical protein